MIKNICKSFLNKKKAFQVANKNLSYFSTKLAPEKERLEDWQYVQQISKSLKENDINEALSYLIQSHLNNQILNKQIYYSVQQKFEEASAVTGYHEILYKLYREHFQPNPMTLNWMKRISRTQNEILVELLKKDFEKLNEAFPISMSNTPEEKSAVKIVQDTQSDQQQPKAPIVGRKTRKVPTVPSVDQYYSSKPQTITIKRKEPQQKISFRQTKPITPIEQIPSQEKIEQAIAQKFQEMMEMMFKEYGKITLHNVEFQINEDMHGPDLEEEMNEMYNEEYQNQHGDEDHEGDQNHDVTMEDMILDKMDSISKIKIGRIQFENPHILEKIKTQLDNTKEPNNK